MRTPSPSMAVAGIALFVALGGTAVAAVDFARNAGAVDGKSAHSARASRAAVAGDLVATERSGAERGTIPSKFLDPDLMRGGADNFNHLADVSDNAAGAPAALFSIPGLADVSMACSDQDSAVGIENPVVTVTVVPTGGGLNYARQTGQPLNRERPGRPFIASIAQGAREDLVLNTSDTFDLRLERAGLTAQVLGVARQDGSGTPAASCLVYGTVFTVR